MSSRYDKVVGNNPHLRQKIEVNEGRNNIYWTISMINNTALPVLAEFSETYNAPVVENARDYQLAIIRFVVPGGSIPILNFKNKVYYVTLQYGATIKTILLEYETLININGNDTIFSYQAMMRIINEAFKEAFNELIGTVGPIVGCTAPPFMEYVPQTNMCPLFAQSGYVNTIKVFMNTRLYGLFGNFMARYTPTNVGYEFEIILEDQNTTNTSSSNIFVPTGYIMMQQDYPTLSNWADFVEINFISNTLGVASDFYPIANNSDQLVTNNNSGNGPSTSPYLADFRSYQNNLDPGGIQGSNYFAAQGPWVMKDLQKNTIDKLDIKIVLKNRQGEQFDYYIPPYDKVDIKFAFVKKN